MLFFALIGVVITCVGIGVEDGILTFIGGVCAIWNGANFFVSVSEKRKGTRK